MGDLKSYKDLIVWQKSIAMVTAVYELVKSFPDTEKFGLTSQIKRCSVSVPSNIAEGYGRATTKYYIQFLRTSRGSLFELETQLLIGKNLKYINDSEQIDNAITEISKMLNSLIKKLEAKL
jgi:four helix bundle protein